MESTHKKKVLVFIDWFRPAFLAGGPIQSVNNIIKSLGDEYHFYICTSNTDVGINQPLEGITMNTWVNFSSNSEIIYLDNAHRNSKILSKIITSHSYESIYFNSLFSYSFSLKPLFLAKRLQHNSKLILAPRGMLGAGSLKIKKIKKLLFLFMAKRLNLFKEITWHVSSEIEKSEVLLNFKKADTIQIAQNLLSQPEQDFIEKTKKENELQLFYLSRISEVKNLKHALAILNHSYSGKITYTIYGPIEDELYWRECKVLIKALPSNIKVIYYGSLKPHEVQKTITQHHFLFLTTLNENFGHSIVESFLSSKPVIIPNTTPWVNLEKQQVGWDIILQDELRFRAVIEACLAMNQNEYNQLSKKAHEFGISTSQNEIALNSNRMLFSK